VTGPLLARALGASGRGDLQAVIVPLSLVPIVLSFGISGFAYRALPRGRCADEVIGSLGLPLLVSGVVVAALSVPIADGLAGGRHTVRMFLIIGLAATPIVMMIMLLSSSLAALERWRAVVAMTVIPFALPFVATVGLYAAGQLTVATAAASAIGASLLAVIPGIQLLISIRRPVFRRSLAREGVSFGVKSWLGGLAQTANARLDQFAMITIVSPRQLGLYAVATTVSMASGLVTGGLAPPLMTRIASGERHLIPRVLRMTLTLTLALNAAIALVTPTLLSLLFGRQFDGAVPMALVLLGASVPLAGASVLSTALQADGVPLIPTVGEVIALFVTVGGLAVLLKPLQGMGAAVVSLAAYTASFAYQLISARRRLGVALAGFLLPTGADVDWVRRRTMSLTPRFGAQR
jgi:O-antigen/teichoic acid export membrane protein